MNAKINVFQYKVSYLFIYFVFSVCSIAAQTVQDSTASSQSIVTIKTYKGNIYRGVIIELRNDTFVMLTNENKRITVSSKDLKSYDAKTIALPPPIKKAETNRFYNKQYAVISAGLGTQSILYYKKIDSFEGTNKIVITDINDIPITLKGEMGLERLYGLGITINRLYHHQVYDALWDRGRDSNVATLYRFERLDHRISLNLRNNFYLVRNKSVEFFIGFGLGLAYFENVYKITPEPFERDPKEDYSYLRVIALELSGGLRVYPFKNKELGLMLELGLTQSYAQFGLSYRIFTGSIVK